MKTNEQVCAERIQREVIYPIRDEVFNKLPKWLTSKFFVEARVKRFCEVIVDISREYVEASIKKHHQKCGWERE